jgi:glycosyltransferase involved in cell wall biosynthesis
MPPEPTVLYVGRVHPEKGVQLLVDAFRRVVARVPAARLKIVGPVEKRHGGGGSGYLESLKSTADGLPVEFAGAISDDRALSRTYQEADCFCYPSLAEKGEAFGRAVLEAMATGLPCVVSNLECFADFLKHDADGLVFDHRSKAPQEALADAICSILLDPGKADSLGASARRAAERFSASHITEAYLALFSSLLSPLRDANR